MVNRGAGLCPGGWPSTAARVIEHTLVRFCAAQPHLIGRVGACCRGRSVPGSVHNGPFIHVMANITTIYGLGFSSDLA